MHQLTHWGRALWQFRVRSRVSRREQSIGDHGNGLINNLNTLLDDTGLPFNCSLRSQSAETPSSAARRRCPESATNFHPTVSETKSNPDDPTFLQAAHLSAGTWVEANRGRYARMWSANA